MMHEDRQADILAYSYYLHYYRVHKQKNGSDPE